MNTICQIKHPGLDNNTGNCPPFICPNKNEANGVKADYLFARIYIYFHASIILYLAVFEPIKHSPNDAKILIIYLQRTLSLNELINNIRESDLILPSKESDTVPSEFPKWWSSFSVHVVGDQIQKLYAL